ncbi:MULTISPECIES: poly-gamma-glutamate synthase PgsB [unclassified Fusibacter]|uniref:poly-gamma-glutamate synthase PgsB n=1 Tax=unclassified Fusibacter TaxID=2624464 RepID=UPI001012CA0F|nr:MULTISPECIES: poly-gamma-glutamate synthase PgsB [unclassified Fusibacter]MCK8061072.1 poly-gamma-glutamate synthase PgsB [Fusibacter sp. A2]NPE20474.1 poly-gamma-glutamate synthase PgsB [Fusibacter sp. A1]RXV63678.1 poly-gamma-glutamate synthase PgsB [Fusibacter sp. A1]
MIKTITTYTVLVYFGFLIIEGWYLRRVRERLPYVIHVNGIRGKSTLVWMLDGISREIGYKTFSKVTGTKPEYRGVDGKRVSIQRRKMPNILEQKKMLYLAAKQNADILIIECMAVNPYLQKKSSEMIRPNLTLITNVRLDHMEVMGMNRDEIAQNLAQSITEDSVVVVEKSSYLERFIKVAEIKGSVCKVRKEYREFPVEKGLDSCIKQIMEIESEHEDNCAMALQVAEIMGWDIFTTVKGISKRVRDVYSSKEIEMGSGVVAYGFAINDLDSTQLFYQKLVKKYETMRKAVLFNDRIDRPLRRLMFLSWLVCLNPERIYLSGSMKSYNRRKLVQNGYEGMIVCVDNIDDIEYDEWLVVGIGNLKGFAEKMMEELHA